MSGSGPCSSCRKRCCTSYTVSITGYDAWWIGKGLFMPLESFLVYFPVSEQNERGFLLDPNGPRHEIALDKVGSYQKGNPCVFWVELVHGGGRCGIYPYRPLVCQTYPAYQSEETVVLREDVLCPEGAWNLVGMDLPVFRERLSRFRMQQDIHAYVVAGWNRSVDREEASRSITEFFSVLMNIYEPLHRWLQTLPQGLEKMLAREWGALPAAAPNPLFADVMSAGEDESWHSALSGIRSCIHRSAPWCSEGGEIVSLVA